MESKTLPKAAAVRIRPAAPADAERIVAMIQGLAAHHGDAATVSVAALARDVFADPPWLWVLVAERAGHLVGYAALAPLVKLQAGERGLDIHHLWVEAEHRGERIGRALVDAAIAEARRLGCASITIGTHADNTEAQARYRAMGFQPASPPGPRFRLRFGD